MVEKEFKSLSERIKDIEDELQKDSVRKQKCFLNPVDVLNKLETNIKQAVKLLKEKMCVCGLKEYSETICSNCAEIDKIFGDKLTGD